MLQFLLLIAEEDDHERIASLYNRYHDDMLRYATYKLRQMGLPNYVWDAEDVVQNAFVKITKYISRINFSGTDREIRAYVLTIVTNEAINIKADYTYFDDINEPLKEIEDGDFFGQLRIQDRYDAVVSVIKSMDEKYSIALLYKYHDNMSIPEMSELLGIAEKTVYTRIERGKRLLLEALKEES